MDKVIIAFKTGKYDAGLKQLRAGEPNIEILYELPIINGVSAMIPTDRRATMIYRNRNIERVELCAAVTYPNIHL